MNLHYHKYSNKVMYLPSQLNLITLSQSTSYQGFSLHVSVPLPKVKTLRPRQQPSVEHL